MEERRIEWQRPARIGPDAWPHLRNDGPARVIEPLQPAVTPSEGGSSEQEITEQTEIAIDK